MGEKAITNVRTVGLPDLIQGSSEYETGVQTTRQRNPILSLGLHRQGKETWPCNNTEMNYVMLLM